jgi:hypothetical protein
VGLRNAYPTRGAGVEFAGLNIVVDLVTFAILAFELPFRHG